MIYIYYWRPDNFTLLSGAVNYVTWYLALCTVSVVKMESEMGRRGLAGIYYTDRFLQHTHIYL
jgi:hypothetical protein